MKETGKISIRFFLNKNVNPIRYPLLDNEDYYPLYVQVTYNRKNTQFRSSSNTNYYASLEQAYKIDKERIASEEKLILKVVEYEISYYSERFQLKGLKDRYYDYTTDVKHHIDIYLRNVLYEALTKSKSKYWRIIDPMSNYNISIILYYEASKQLINNIDSLLPKGFNEDLNAGQEYINWSQKQTKGSLLIDWLDKSLLESYRKYLKRRKLSNEVIDQNIDFINKVIRIQTGFVLV